MRYLIALALMVAMGLSFAGGAKEGDPLVRGNIYVDLARAGDRVVAVGDRGHIVYSDDEGLTWQKGETPTGVLLTAVCFADAMHGWAVGHDAVVLGTRDGGETWVKQYSDELDPDAGFDDEYDDDYYDDDYDYDDIYSYDPYDDGMDDAVAAVDTSGAPLLDVWCASPERALAIGGYGYVVETNDAGDTWEQRHDLIENPEGWHLYSIISLDGEPDVMFVVGEQGRLYRSQDRGQSWDELDSPYHGSFFGAVSADPGTLLVFGLQGNVWLSRDRGDSWSKVPSGVTSGVSAGTVLPDGAIVLVGNAGVVLTSRNQGSILSLRFQPDRRNISSVLPRKNGGVLVAGASGVRIIETLQ